MTAPQKRVIFQDPEHCKACGLKGRVIESRRGRGYRKRRRLCTRCQTRWTTYESLINVERAMSRKRREVLAADAAVPTAAPTETPSTTTPPPTVTGPIAVSVRPARMARSRYLSR